MWHCIFCKLMHITCRYIEEDEHICVQIKMDWTTILPIFTILLLCRYWNTIIKLESFLFLLMWSLRESDFICWCLDASVILMQVYPWMFAFDNINYSWCFQCSFMWVSKYVSNTTFARAPVCSPMFWWELRLIVGAQLERVSWAARCICCDLHHGLVVRRISTSQGCVLGPLIFSLYLLYCRRARILIFIHG